VTDACSPAPIVFAISWPRWVGQHVEHHLILGAVYDAHPRHPRRACAPEREFVKLAETAGASKWR